MKIKALKVKWKFGVMEYMCDRDVLEMSAVMCRDVWGSLHMVHPTVQRERERIQIS